MAFCCDRRGAGVAGWREVNAYFNLSQCRRICQLLDPYATRTATNPGKVFDDAYRDATASRDRDHHFTRPYPFDAVSVAFDLALDRLDVDLHAAASTPPSDSRGRTGLEALLPVPPCPVAGGGATRPSLLA